MFETIPIAHVWWLHQQTFSVMGFGKISKQNDIIEFENLAAVKAWRDHSEHQEAQILRRERFSFIVSFESM